MDAWSAEEDRRLLHLIDVHGTSWKVIDELFPSRSSASIRNRFQRIVNGSKQGGKNRCHRCGLVKRGHSCEGGVRTFDAEKAAPPPVMGTGEGGDEEIVHHLFSWDTVETAHAMGFEDVTHPPPLVYQFPFATSLPRA